MNEIELPKQIPLFPLPGVLLLPGGNLPLHIFEQRYLDMVNDALAGARVIGMVQPRLRHSNLHEPPLCNTGCAGYITQHEETSDGRMLIVLSGLCRFHIVNELDNDTLYRTADVNWLPGSNVAPQDQDLDKHARLLTAASNYLPMLNEEFDSEQIRSSSLPDLVTVLSMHCPFSAMEKQSLLEAPDLAQRTDILIDLLERAMLDNWRAEDHAVN
jgi:Lon protease-like protein